MACGIMDCMEVLTGQEDRITLLTYSVYCSFSGCGKVFTEIFQIFVHHYLQAYNGYPGMFTSICLLHTLFIG